MDSLACVGKDKMGCQATSSLSISHRRAGSPALDSWVHESIWTWKGPEAAGWPGRRDGNDTQLFAVRQRRCNIDPWLRQYRTTSAAMVYRQPIRSNTADLGAKRSQVHNPIHKFL